MLPAEQPRPPNSKKVDKILQKVQVRDDARFLAKIAFGIQSPSMEATKISRKGVFDTMNDCDFKELLGVFEKACGE